MVEPEHLVWDLTEFYATIARDIQRNSIRTQQQKSGKKPTKKHTPQEDLESLCKHIKRLAILKKTRTKIAKYKTH